MTFKTGLTLALTLTMLTSIYSQCPTEDQFLYNQLAIDSFIIKYPNCTNIKADINIAGDNVENLEGLSNIDSIYGKLSFQGLKNLKDLTALSKLTYIFKSLSLSNTHFINLKGMDSLLHIGGINFHSNKKLISLEGLSKLSSIAGKIFIYGNAALENVNGLEKITYINSIDIRQNPSLKNIDSLSNITDGRGRYLIGVNESLENIDGLSGLNPTTTISLNIYSLPSLTSLQGISHIIQIDDLSIENCDKLTSLTGLTKLRRMQPNSYFSIVDNDGLVNLEGVNKLFMAGNITISGNSKLIDLEGLSGVFEISGNLKINNNSSLENIEGLSRLNNVTDSIVISQNSSLDECRVKWLCKQLLKSKSDIRIIGNSENCETLDIAKNRCQNTSTSNIQLIEQISLSPNPSHSTISINIPSEINHLSYILEVYDYYGKQLNLMEHNGSTHLYIGDFPSGTLFIRMIFEDSELRKTIMISKI